MALYSEQDANLVVALYLRKSRKDKALEDAGIDTLERHEKILRDMAAKNGYIIGEIYKEVVSADSIEARPEMQRLINDIHNNKWQGVLVTELERLARGDTKDQGIVAEAFKFSECLIITPDKIYNPNDETDEEYFEFGLFMSRREYKAIKRRMQAGLKLSCLEGNYLGSKPPFGYDIVDRGRRDRTLVPNEYADIVRMIFSWYTEECATNCEIARRLTNMGIPTPKKLGYWSNYSITKILKNYHYIGKVTRGIRQRVKEFDAESGKLKSVMREGKDPIIADGKHPAIISVEQFEKAQERMSKNLPIRRGKVLKNGFAGLLRCSNCGIVLNYKQTTHKGVDYISMRHRPNMPGCVCVSARYDEILQATADALAMYIADFQFKVKNGSSEDAVLHAKMISTMENNLEKLKAKRKKLMQYFEDDIYTEEEFLERKADINEEITVLTAQLEEAKSEEPNIIDYEEKIVKFSEVMDALRNPDTPAKEVNNLLKEIICRIDYTRKSRKEPFQLDITLL